MRSLLALLLTAMLQLGGLGAAQASAVYKVGGFLPDLRFTLSSAGNPAVTEADFKDKVVMLFFGYASCPDICPITMAQLAQVRQNLGDDADKVRIIFISVDPHRDTPDMLQAYVEAFGSDGVGLTGTERQIAAVAKRYRVSYQMARPSGPEGRNYEVTHSRGIYFFDSRGKARFLASDGESIDTLTETARQLITETAR